MIRYIYGEDLNKFPMLARSMFRDRADQFATRLGWEVSVDERGEERDEYDRENPLYVIWEKPAYNARARIWTPFSAHPQAINHLQYRRRGTAPTHLKRLGRSRFSPPGRASRGAPRRP